MRCLDHLKIMHLGFSPTGMASLLSCANLGLLPFHFIGGNDAPVSGFACILLLGSTVFALATPRGTRYRFRPIAVAAFAIILHTLLYHG
jgi:hypothetical protein